MTPDQCWVARGVLGWNRAKLAKMAGVKSPDVMMFEYGQFRPPTGTMAKLRAALESAGLEFVAANDGVPGVKLLNSPTLHTTG